MRRSCKIVEQYLVYHNINDILALYSIKADLAVSTQGIAVQIIGSYHPDFFSFMVMSIILLLVLTTI
jgi:hypothetical protein